MNKKGQMSSGPEMILSWIIAFGLIGLIASVFLLINTEFKEETYLFTTTSVTNESGAYVNSTGYTLSGASDFKAKDFVITAAWNVTNVTDPVLIASGNYTVSTAGVLTNASTTTWSTVNVSHTHKVGESTTATEGIEDASSGIAKITSKLPLIGTIIVLSVILVIVLAVVAYVRLQAGAYGNVQ